MARHTLARTHGTVVPFDAEPLEIPENLLLSPWDVSSRIGVVDSKQHPVPECAVRDRAQGIPDVQGARRARCKANTLHRRQSRRRKPLRQTPADPPDGEREQRDGEPRVQTALDALEEPEPMCGLDDVHVEEPVGSHATVERSRRGMRIRRTGRGDVERRDQTTEAVVSPLAEHPGAGMRHIRAGYGNVFHRHGRDKVATYEAGYDEPEPHEADERHRHRRHGSPEDGSRGNSERDRKQRIGDRYDALLVEDPRLEAVAGRGVERSDPPGDERRICDGECERQADERDELGGQPAKAADPLRPDETMRSLFELTRDERRAPEKAGEKRQAHEERDELAECAEAALERTLEISAVAMAANGETAAETRVEGRAYVQSGYEQKNRDQGKCRGTEERLLTVLPVREPGHTPASTRWSGTTAGAEPRTVSPRYASTSSSRSISLTDQAGSAIGPSTSTTSVDCLSV